MANRAIIVGIVAVIIASVYQFFVRDLLFVFLGIGRDIQPIEDFPYSCHKIYGSENLLQSCEDVWLDHEDRTLYAACTDVESRDNWSPG